MAKPCPPHCWLKTYRVPSPISSRPPAASNSLNHHTIAQTTGLPSALDIPLTPTHIPILALWPGEAHTEVVSSLIPSILFNSGFLSHGQTGPIQRKSYTALTYSHGDDGDTEQMMVNGAPARVSRDLVAALRAMRNPDMIEYFWVDALGTSKSSISERILRRGNVFKTYCAAERCVVWLGGEAGSTKGGMSPEEKAMVFLGEFDAEVVHSEECAGGLAAVCVGIGSLASRPWWERSWIRKEVFASNEVIIRVGDVYMPFERLRQNVNGALKMIETFKTKHEQLANSIDATGVQTLIQLADRVGRAAPVDS